MMTMHDRDELFARDHKAYVAMMNRRLRELDAAIASSGDEREEDRELRAWVSGEDYFADFRARTARDAVDALAALGVSDPAVSWRLGCIETRVWLIELASGTERRSIEGLPTWRGPAMVRAESPYGRWLLWTHVYGLALGVRDARLSRKFGKPHVTRADVEEARLGCEISNDRWLAICETVAWVIG